MCRVLTCSLRGPRSTHRCVRAKTPRCRRPRDDARNAVEPPPPPSEWTRPCLGRRRASRRCSSCRGGRRPSSLLDVPSARTPGQRSTGERAGFILLHAPPASAAAAPPWPARLERPWYRRSLREREMRGRGEKMTRVRPVGTFVRAPSRAGRPIRSSGSQRRGAPARAFGH